MKSLGNARLSNPRATAKQLTQVTPAYSNFSKSGNNHTHILTSTNETNLDIFKTIAIYN